MLYAADLRWWEWHAERPEMKRFEGQRCTIFNTGGLIKSQDIFVMRNEGTEGMSETPNALCTGSTSGYQAVNLAMLAGASTIALLGYEMHFPKGKSHWHGGHPIREAEGSYIRWARLYRSALPVLKRRGVRVVNCTPDSRIDAFERGTLESVLPHP